MKKRKGYIVKGFSFKDMGSTSIEFYDPVNDAHHGPRRNKNIKEPFMCGHPIGNSRKILWHNLTKIGKCPAFLERDKEKLRKEFIKGYEKWRKKNEI